MKATFKQLVAVEKEFELNSTRFTFRIESESDNTLYTVEEVNERALVMWVENDGSIGVNNVWHSDQIRRFVEKGKWIVQDVLVGSMEELENEEIIEGIDDYYFRD